MTAQNTFVIFTGDDKTMYMRAVNVGCNGDPLDLTDCTEIVVALPNADGTFSQRKLSEDTVVITTPALLGKFSVIISSLISALLNPGELQNVDVTFTIAGKEFTVRFYEALTVFERD